MLDSREILRKQSLPENDLGDLPTSAKRFADGSTWKVEIPSVEGPEAFREVLAAAAEMSVPVHRISQGSGIMMQTDDEIREMVALGAEHDIEVCLFTGPRASWDTGVQVTAQAGRIIAGSLRGADQLRYGLEDVQRGCELGLRSILIGDLGLLAVVGRAIAEGDLPSDLIIKVSVSMPVANPATARVLEDLGASTLNLPVDLHMSSIAAIRSAVDIPVDVYMEAADEFGGTVRHFEVPDLVKVAAPVYVKFTVRNAPGIYPSGGHLRSVVLATARERVRRAALGLAHLERAERRSAGRG
jgi:hypothetical protein